MNIFQFLELDYNKEKEKKMKVEKEGSEYYISIGAWRYPLQFEGVSGTDPHSYTHWVTINGGLTPEPEKQEKEKNPYVPEAIYCNSSLGVTVVKWNDGTETRVTCDMADSFSPESGFYAALAIKVFGNSKKEFKNFWYPMISRKVFLDGEKVAPLSRNRWKNEKRKKLKREE
jgi:hypothetical protein